MTSFKLLGFLLLPRVSINRDWIFKQFNFQKKILKIKRQNKNAWFNMRIIACQDLIRSQTTGVEGINIQATSKEYLTIHVLQYALPIPLPCIQLR